MSTAYKAERALVIGGAIVWLVVFLLLTELEGAAERASETYGEKKPAEAVDREAPKEPDQ